MTQDELHKLAATLPDVHAAVVSAVSRMGEEERLYHLTQRASTMDIWENKCIFGRFG